MGILLGVAPLPGPPGPHGGDLVAKVLKAEGVTHVFGLSGGHVSAIFDGLLTEGIRFIDTRHEEASSSWTSSRPPATPTLTGTDAGFPPPLPPPPPPWTVAPRYRAAGPGLRRSGERSPPDLVPWAPSHFAGTPLPGAHFRMTQKGGPHVPSRQLQRAADSARLPRKRQKSGKPGMVGAQGRKCTPHRC